MKYKEPDIEEIVSLFYETVISVNSKDYSESEIDAWAPKDEKKLKVQSWKKSLSQNITYVAKVNEKIVGFSDLTHSGHLDRLYVHKDYQRQGIATALVDMLESAAKELNLLEIKTEASITAKPFFEKRGYKGVCSQIIERKGINLTNFIMVKNFKLKA
jgi:putative acetyltransferase